jgi:hypothetical protein
MRHPFDGITTPSTEPAADPGAQPTRRAALERMVAATAGVLGIQAAAQAGDREVLTKALPEGGVQVATNCKGEFGMSDARSEGGLTSLAVGEEGGTFPSFQLTQPPALQDLKPEQFQSAWNQLASVNQAEAYAGITILATAKQTVPFLIERLQPATPADAAKIARLIEDLDSNAFAKRQKAATELEKIGPPAEPALRKALESKPALELRRRVESILERMLSLRLQSRRSLQVLLLLATPEAIGLLASLTVEKPGAWQTAEAKATFGQMRRITWSTQTWWVEGGYRQAELDLIRQLQQMQKLPQFEGKPVRLLPDKEPIQPKPFAK